MNLLTGADFVQSQMIFDLDTLRAFLDRAADGSRYARPKEPQAGRVSAS
jgi:5,10-methylenetetrahydrofolate reductase